MPKIKIKIIPKAKQNKVIKDNNQLKVYTIAPAIKNRANKAVIKLLAKFFNAKKSGIKIIKGKKAREKVVEIGEG
jgi:uncharacterized protein (TIGR00251 family)